MYYLLTEKMLIYLFTDSMPFVDIPYTKVKKKKLIRRVAFKDVRSEEVWC